jgi:hypothetical protein
MVVNEKTLSKYGYDICHQKFIEQLNNIVSNGLELEGKRHAVRLAFLQGDGLEKTYQMGMAHSFSKVNYTDPHSFITRDDRLQCTDPEDLFLKAEDIRNPESYDDDVLSIGTVNSNVLN